MNYVEYNGKIIEYEIIKSNIKNVYIQIKENKVVVKAPYKIKEKDIQNLVNKKASWIYKKLQNNEVEKEDLYSEKEFEVIVQEIFEDLINRTGLRPKKARIRDIKYAWGTCSINKNITINSKLIKYSKKTIEYVILHELCHIKHMNHSKEFWKLVSTYMPDYKEIRKELKNK